ncbi:MAG: UTP--glucose-1-phosphate uridylyltransferase [Paracoccaceae bacterium]
MRTQIDTAIFPVAGMGTRMLPATKSVPKELLPVYDRPLIQLAVDEAIAAGITRMIFVSHPSKAIIEEYFQPDETLLEALEAGGKTDIVDTLHNIAPDDNADIRFVMQDEPLGLGHAILCARNMAGDGPVAVILPDDVLMGHGCAMSDMICAYENSDAAHMVASMPVLRAEVSKYGIIEPDEPTYDTHLRVRGLVEKPSPQDAPSNLAVIGRYILGPDIFDTLSKTKAGAGGEIQLTDAIASSVGTCGVSAFRLTQDRFDCGHPEGLLEASLARREWLLRREEVAA